MKNAVKILSVAVLASVLLLTACFFEFDTRPIIAAPEIIPVQNITGIPTGSLPFIELPLSATVMPETATNKRIEWSIASNGAGAALKGNILTANSEGMVTVKAVIKDGVAVGKDYTQNFDIDFLLISPVPVIDIQEIPPSMTRGTYTLNPLIIPTNALNQTILWTVKDAGTTGASIYGNVLTTTERGTVVLTATIVNGLLEQGDYTQDFTIVVTKNVYTAGHYGSPYKACYWIDDKLYDLDMSGIPDGTRSMTTGIVFAGGKLYISGGYGDQDITFFPYSFRPDGSDPKYSIVYTYTTTACYWVDGIRHDLDGTQTLSIAADGDDVYITGFTMTPDVNIINAVYSYCYWKIDGNGVVTKKPLNDPGSKKPANSGTSTSVPSGATYRERVPANTADVNVGRLAVSGGNVYIPFYYKYNIVVYTYTMDAPQNLNYRWDNVTLKSYYWDETGVINDISFDCAVKSAAVINGNVYMAGFLREGTNPYIYPCYFVKGDASATFNRGDFISNWQNSNVYSYDYNASLSGNNPPIRSNAIYDDGVGSIVAQNGTPWFYCTRSRADGVNVDNEFRFNTTGSNGYMAPSDYMYDASKVIFSEGDVYIAIREDMWVSTDLYIGYAVLDGVTASEKQVRILIDPEGKDTPFTRGQISGIAVP